MLGRSFFRQMDEDAFFSDHRDHMRRMDDMFRDPFRGFGMLENGQGSDRRHDRGGTDRGSSNEMAPFRDFGFGNMFGNMSSMMQNMDRTFAQASQGGGNGASFQQSSFMSYSNTGEGPPKVFQASSATRSGPGGVRETRKTVRDSERELEKMAVGHHIHERGHEMEKHRNTRSGQIDEMQNFHNIDEGDAEAFNREWQEKSHTAFKGLDHQERRGERREIRERHSDDRDRRRGERRDRGREKQLALPDPRSPTGSEDRRSEHWGKSTGRQRRDRS